MLITSPVVHVATKMRRNGSHEPAMLPNMARLRWIKPATTTRSSSATMATNANAVGLGSRAPGCWK